VRVSKASRAAAALAAVAAIAFSAGAARATVSAAAPTRAVMILLDVNGTFPAADFTAEKAAATAYLDALPSDVRAGLITFYGAWNLVTGPTTDRQTVAAAISSASSLGQRSTGLAGALADAQSALSALGASVDGRVLVLSDAEELTGTLPASALPVDVVTWAFESDDNAAALHSLAAASSGRSVAPADAASLASAFPAVAPVPTPTAVPAPQHVTAGSPLPASAPWRFSKPFLAAVGALVVAIVAMVVVASGLSSSGRRGRRLAGQVAQYGPSHAAHSPDDNSARSGGSPSKVAGAAVGLAERALEVRGLDRTLAARLDVAGMTAKPGEFVVLGACASFVLAAGLTILVGSFLIGVPAGLLAGWLVMRLLVSLRMGRRRAAFGEQLPDVLQLIASSLQSGFSLAQALDAVVREGSQPAAGEFSRALGEARIGADIADALDGVAARMDSQDMRWSVMAIRIQRSVGGNLAEVLRNTIATMRERAFLRRHVKALSAEGRLSAYILVGLPIVLGGWLFYSSRSYMQLLYTTTFGLMMLTGAIALVVIGAFWMRALIKVEV
jgi:Flp pilus assembly protein TadB